jgi:hypothetical protein
MMLMGAVMQIKLSILGEKHAGHCFICRRTLLYFELAYKGFDL